MKTKLLFLCLLFVTQIHAQIPQESVTKLNTVFDSLCRKYNLKGASAAMIIPGIGTWKSVYGISHGNTPITEDTKMGIGSNTKTYISVLLLKLQEEGVLDLDDTIGTWIKNVPNVNGQITIRQMLNHTSGLYSFTVNEAWIDDIFKDLERVWKPDEILPYIAKPKFAAGKSWSYSNTNYLLAGIIIEKVTQKPLHIVLREKILSPQGLNNTFLFPDETTVGPLAHPWTYAFNWKAPMQDITSESEKNLNSFYSCAWAAGALMTTAEDNARFWHRLMEGLIINEHSMAELKKYVRVSTTVGYGLGIFREKNFNGRTVYSHGGTGFGYVNENIVDSTNGIVISLLTNQDSVGNGILLNQIITALHKVTMQDQVLSVNAAKDFSAQISVFPNPSNGKFYVHIPAEYINEVRIHVINLLGQQIIPETIFQSNNRTQPIDLSGKEKGIYFILIKTGNEVYTKRIILN